jgi:hypothetical protein
VACSTARAGSVEDRQSIGRGPGTQRESPKVRGIAGHIEQTERGFGRKYPQAHKHFCPLLPTAMVFVSYGYVLVQVQVQESRKAKSQQRRFRNRNLPSTRGRLRLGFAAVLSPYQENLPAAFLVHKYIITNNLPPLSLLGRIFSSEPSSTPFHLLSAVKAQGRTDAGGLS